jgi:hypothetical protein
MHSLSVETKGKKKIEEPRSINESPSPIKFGIETPFPAVDYEIYNQHKEYPKKLTLTEKQ